MSHRLSVYRKDLYSVASWFGVEQGYLPQTSGSPVITRISCLLCLALTVNTIGEPIAYDYTYIEGHYVHGDKEGLRGRASITLPASLYLYGEADAIDVTGEHQELKLSDYQFGVGFHIDADRLASKSSYLSALKILPLDGVDIFVEAGPRNWDFESNNHGRSGSDIAAKIGWRFGNPYSWECVVAAGIQRHAKMSRTIDQDTLTQLATSETDADVDDYIDFTGSTEATYSFKFLWNLRKASLVVGVEGSSWNTHGVTVGLRLTP
ncbi:MAG: hypothetical protein VX211_06825 [Pseudomonadota bacterium]|nr:hypothetical protein [Pseudomonadota bacterium]